jgi:predicted ABC-type ATPase
VVKLIFLSLPDPETALARVAERVAQGGHAVPEATVRRRFAAGLKNFFYSYKGLVDMWQLYDNASMPPALIAEGGNP